MSSNLPSRLAALSHAQRIHLFELLAHKLTVSARVAWSSTESTAPQQLEALKCINECLHRVTASVSAERLRTHAWRDEDFLAMLAAHDAVLPAAVKGTIEWALKEALTRVEGS